VVAAYDPQEARQFVEVHNLFLTDPEAFVRWAQGVGLVGVELRAGYADEAYRPCRGSDVAVLVARREAAG
jgi:hypothetical protein